ncbi:MAG: hypothetical protein LBG77_05475, partial [Dysgonamonadaceae bacterium]|nr:hypothetical protein [Dysgonamonadaceae bacterium]
MEIEEKFNKKLLVEGNDDQHVVWALCRQCGITESFDVRDCKSVDKAKKNLSVSLKLIGVKTVGIIIDADIDLESRWNSVRNILIDNKFIVPKELPREGLILNNGDKKAGVWIMPNNTTTGMLEDFITFLVPQNDKLLPIVDTTLNHIETQKLHQYADT